jgi:hypothetical protein
MPPAPHAADNSRENTMHPERPGPEVRPRAEMVDIGPCRFCQDPVWAKPTSLVHEAAPAHPCCAIHARENPGQPCIACAASKRLQRREHD